MLYAFREISSPHWLNEKRLHDQKIAILQEKLARITSVEGQANRAAVEQRSVFKPTAATGS